MEDFSNAEEASKEILENSTNNNALKQISVTIDQAYVKVVHWTAASSEMNFWQVLEPEVTLV